MSDENSKFYTAEEAAVLVLKKTEEMYKNSKLAKSNSSHEVETGEEASNDDAECPAYLAEADIESGSSTGKHGESQSGGGSVGISSDSNEGELDENGKPKKKKTISEDVDGDGKADISSEDTDGDGEVDSVSEDVDGDGKADITVSESSEDSEDSEKKENPFAKAEKLNKFMYKMKGKKMDKTCDSGSLDKKVTKNKKIEKFLGLGGDKTSAQNGTVNQGAPKKPAQGQSIADKINFGGKKPAAPKKPTPPNPPKVNGGY